MKITEYGNIWVCHDCYFGHHYGWQSHERPLTGAETSHYLHGYLNIPGEVTETAEGLTVKQWFAGDSDTPCDREPFALWVQDHQFADNTCSDHCPDPDGVDPCMWCHSTDPESGIDHFSMRSCSGCGSTLGGQRYRLSVFTAD